MGYLFAGALMLVITFLTLVVTSKLAFEDGFGAMSRIFGSIFGIFGSAGALTCAIIFFSHALAAHVLFVCGR